MQLDDEICCCYHVSLRKLLNFAHRERPVHPTRMSECLSAGTGCGWCIPILCQIWSKAREGDRFVPGMTAEEYVAARARYRSERRLRHQFEFDAGGGGEPAPQVEPAQPAADAATAAAANTEKTDADTPSPDTGQQ